MKKYIKLIKNRTLAKLALISFMTKNGYFNLIGWTNSYKTKLPVAQDGSPLPWVTYPFIDFIDERLNKEMSIFEFGSGNSTIYYAKKVKEVYSVEHDETWFTQIKQQLPSNANLFHQSLIYNDEYCRYPTTLNLKFDIIIVDGRDRVNCMIHAVNNLTKNGVIVLDNSDRLEYTNGINKLLEQKFKKIDFWGLAPGFLHETCTTIFYKSENCLNI